MSKRTGQALGSIFGAGVRRVAEPVMPAMTMPSAPPSVSAFLAVVDRVEAVLDAETQALTRQIPSDMTEFGNRKRQGLLEMSRALRAAVAEGPRADIRDRLTRFAAKLERNRTVLGAQLLAVREISDIIAQTLREAESDGTYSAPALRS
ncbi:MAG: hypothetical protein ACRYGP_03215 [Janthinobacterium lividum]